MVYVSRPEVLYKNDVLSNFAKFTERHLCQSLFFNKVAGLRLETLSQVFSCEFCKVSKNAFSYRTFWWLLLDVVSAYLKQSLEISH